MEKAWKNMTAGEKLEARFEKWIAGEGIDFISDEARVSYQARTTRLKDVVQLRKTPDRVPVYPFHTFMPVTLFDVLPGEVMYDAEKLVAVWKKYLEEYGPDYYGTPRSIFSGVPLEILDYKLYRWPGHNLSAKSPYQCVENEYMKADEYHAIIDDPSDFFLRTYLPRICGALEPFKNFLPLTGIQELGALARYIPLLGTTEMQKALQALMDAGRKAFEWETHITGFEKWAQANGHVNGKGGISKAPFDVIGDTLRGTRPIMMDMFRHPDLIIEACERFVPIMIKNGVSGVEASGNPVVFMPLHKGADGFMSDEHFRTIYWPTLKQVISGLIEEGCVPLVFAEGGYDTRLEYINELPKGHCIWMFDRTDMARAKDVVGGSTCIMGNVPVSTILSGSVDKVKAICRELIDTAGKNGGYIMSSGCSMDEARPDTLHAMIDFTREYGVY